MLLAEWESNLHLLDGQHLSSKSKILRELVVDNLPQVGCHKHGNEFMTEIIFKFTVPTKLLGTPPFFQCILMALRVLEKMQ